MKHGAGRWLVLGGKGRLGAALVRAAQGFGVEVVALGRLECDIQSPRRVAQALADVSPHVIFNCAAWTAVDLAEESRHEAWRVNAVGPAVIADAAAHLLNTPRVIHVSTDYVFSGKGIFGRPITEGMRPDPLSSYGRSKLAGENALRAIAPDGSLVVRTSWLYGQQGDDFVGQVRQLALSASTAEVVDDQWGSPTLVDDLAQRLCQIAIAYPRMSERPEVLHVANSGYTSRFGLAQAIYRLSGADSSLVKPRKSVVGNDVAVRPIWSALASARLNDIGVPPLGDWQEALARALQP